MEHLYSLEVHRQYVQRERMAEAAAERLLAELPQQSASRRTFGQIAHRAVSQLMAGLLLFASLLLTSSSAFASDFANGHTAILHDGASYTTEVHPS